MRTAAAAFTSAPVAAPAPGGAGRGGDRRVGRGDQDAAAVHGAGAPALRQAVVFAAHDVLADPPFDGLDLVSCRGLLAALPAGGRARVAQTFHQALHPGGVLFPGAGEWPAGGGPREPAADGHPVYRRPGRARALSGGGS